MSETAAEQTLRIEPLGHRERALRAAAGKVAGELEHLARMGGTLLLSGGSAVGIYQLLSSGQVQLPESLQGLEAGLVDEREGSVGHPHSNGRAVQESGLVSALEQRGAVWRELLVPDLSPEARATRYQEWLDQRLPTRPSLAVVGVGADGHTFGVLPQSDAETFRHLFPEHRLVVFYEHPGATAHPTRYTLTPSAGAHLGGVTGVALGAEKERVLAVLGAVEATPSLHRMPALLLRGTGGVLFTDR